MTSRRIDPLDHWQWTKPWGWNLPLQSGSEDEFKKFWCPNCQLWGVEWGRPTWVKDDQTHLQHSCRQCFAMRFWSLRDELALRFLLGNLGLLTVEECNLDHIAMGHSPQGLDDSRKEEALRQARSAQDPSQRLAALQRFIGILNDPQGSVTS